MGLTMASTGRNAVDDGFLTQRQQGERVVALAGNPNVGKSTVFNALTGMKQHTGNWSGKTVSNAQGRHLYHGCTYLMVDIPGTYSLMAHSAEEEVARDFLCFGQPDVVVVVCDATCLERNLNLILQTMEITRRVVVCVNLMDEAKKKQIQLDLAQLEKNLGVPVVGTSARQKEGMKRLMAAVEQVASLPEQEGLTLRYPKAIEQAIEQLIPALFALPLAGLPARWVALRLLAQDRQLLESIQKHLAIDLAGNQPVQQALKAAHSGLEAAQISNGKLRDMIVSSLVLHAEELCSDVVSFGQVGCYERDRKLDRLLTSRATGIPVMLLLLALVFWLTITGANYPSQLLSDVFFRLQESASVWMLSLGAPEWLRGMLVDGMLRVLGWVIAVMLPPMAIFFPLFTLLEDVGYLPRVAFNLDRCFRRCNTCGKQALTIAMGFGCNAAGVTGARIIDSPRERLIAILTNNFVPCNGRLPMLISLITMFFIGTAGGILSTAGAALLLTAFILLGLLATFLMSAALSKTVLKGMPSSFILELPPYRRPQIGQVLVRSVFDRTLFVLGRAAAVAAPAGLLIWLMANLSWGGQSLLAQCAAFLDPFGRLLGMDGVILIAFLLGFPANEIVIPIILMAYLSTGSILELDSLPQLHALLVEHGWTGVTATCTMLFSLLHWPCSTTCLTIHKETGSVKWTIAAVVLPTLLGMAVCFVVATAARLL